MLKNNLKNLVIVISSFVISLIIVEVGLRLVYPQELVGTTRQISASGLLLNRTSGQAHHIFGDRKVTYFFCAFHSRCQDLSIDAPSHSSDRLLALGDSFTWGTLLPYEDTFVGRLDRDLQATHVINAGTGGWGLSDFGDYLDLFCSEIKPDTTIIFLNSDDVGRIRLNNGASYQAQQGGFMKKFFNVIPGSAWATENLHSFALARNSVTAVIWGAPFRAGPSLGVVGVDTKVPTAGMTELRNSDFQTRITKANSLAEQIATIARDCQTNLLWVYLGWVPLDDDAHAGNPTLSWIASIVEDQEKANGDATTLEGFPFLDLSNEPEMRSVQANYASYVIPGDWHPNELGAKAIYESLSSKLSEHGFFATK
jgi:lysophospholipase L1-like esterase